MLAVPVGRLTGGPCVRPSVGADEPGDRRNVREKRPMDQQTIQAQGTGFPGVSAKIERGQRGGYGWELRANVACAPGQDYDAAFADAIGALQTGDGTMRRLFGTVADDLTVTLTKVA